MKTNVETTMENIRDYLENKSGHNYCSEMFGARKGFMAQVMTDERLFWLLFRVDEGIDQLIIEIFPEINCSYAYRAQTSDYVMEKNTEKKIGNIRIEDCGSVHVHIEHGIKDSAISSETIEMLEHIAIKTLIESIDDIEALSHGRYLSKAKENNSLDLLKSMHRDSKGLEELLQGIPDSLGLNGGSENEETSEGEVNDLLATLDELLAASPDPDDTSGDTEADSAQEDNIA